MGGSLITSLISVLTSPLTARVFTPEHFGVWAVIMAISSLLNVVAFSHFPHLILLEKKEEKVTDVLSLSMYFNMMTSIAALGVLTLYMLAGKITGSWYTDPRFFLIPAFTFLNGIITILLIWSNRYCFYRVISINRLLQVLIPVTLQLSIGFFIIASANVILFSQLAGLIVCSAVLLYRYRVAVRKIAFNRPLFFNLAKQNKGLLAISLPTELINNFSNQLPVFFLQKFSGERNVGLFSMSNRLFALPVSFITSSISEVFRQRAVEQYNTQGSCRKLVVKTTLSLLAVTIVPFIIGMIYAPDIFGFVFGENWREAGEYARLIGILFFFKTVVSPVSYVIYIARKFYISLIVDIILLVIGVLSFLAGIYLFGSVKTALFLYAASYALLYFLTFYLSYLYSINKNFHYDQAMAEEKSTV